jgi:hypothetical protein
MELREALVPQSLFSFSAADKRRTRIVVQSLTRRSGIEPIEPQFAGSKLNTGVHYAGEYKNGEKRIEEGAEEQQARATVGVEQGRPEPHARRHGNAHPRSSAGSF